MAQAGGADGPVVPQPAHPVPEPSTEDRPFRFLRLLVSLSLLGAGGASLGLFPALLSQFESMPSATAAAGAAAAHPG